MPETLQIELGPTQGKFVLSEAHIAQIIGPMGEGKTYAGCAGAIAHAARCGRDIRGALVRDTFENIKNSTIPDMKEHLKGWVDFYDGSRKAVIYSTPKVYLDLFGIDDERSISKLQGPQYGFIWLEEPAPIYEKSNAGLPYGVFRMALARVVRQTGTVPRLQITQNPADAEHWTAELAEAPYEYFQDIDQGTGEWVTITKETFRIRPGENAFLNPLARVGTMAAMAGDEGKTARYVSGEEAEVWQGRRVCTLYNPKIHFAERVLPVTHAPLIQMWDSYQHPACVICQYNEWGQLVVHDALYDEGVGPLELCESDVERLFRSPKYEKRKTGQIIGDGTMCTADQSTTRNSAAKMLEGKFKVRFQQGPAHWQTIRHPVNHCWQKTVRGPEGAIPAVIVSRSATKLHRALKGGWHYKTNPSGVVIGTVPEKNEFSHVGDAFGNGIAILMPYDPRKKRKEGPKQDRKKLARSYAGTAGVSPGSPVRGFG